MSNYEKSEGIDYYTKKYVIFTQAKHTTMYLNRYINIYQIIMDKKKQRVLRFIPSVLVNYLFIKNLFSINHF